MQPHRQTTGQSAGGSRDWPQEAERSVLGAILLAASYAVDAGHKVLRRTQEVGLHAAHFGTASYGALYGRMEAMVDEGIPIDAISIAAAIDPHHRDHHLIGHLRILQCEMTAFNSCEHHAKIVIDAAVAREIETRSWQQ